ncbi:murein biosynthesis integral membrane protein MurJ [Megalodesulfovibrio gigas]|uniref:Probable lipid II flippase MurJ n=1 Tax=Megalodesulfovibrio gigas (strain ATCC 19364 / DSM 1382 / NCIMB 9332 / VKM B-1759) TaxID=1121448 RepID=T2GES3_MEGG1|nr:murein biosynthesis integral membrane protein MurJ [Megalodesulfovibrio gigas]AGW14611.1 putative virulence factor MVIN family protein [Megalodesulfovibrio gigas DSM 1382 = ATCC 19364]
MSTTRTIGLAALVMGGSVLLSRFMGLARDKAISYVHGATLDTDIYFTAFVIPDFLNYLLAGGYFSITLIPLLAEKFGRGTPAGEADAWAFFSTVLTWLTAAAVLLTGLAMAFAPQLARLAAPGFDAESLQRLAQFLRIILPAQIFFMAGSCATGLLYLRKQFYAPALSPLIYNGCIILFGLLLPGDGMEGFCWGVLAGSFLGNFLLPFLAAARTAPGHGQEGGAGLRLAMRWRHPDLGRFLLLALPLMLGQSVVVLDEQLVRVFGSLTQEGAVSWLTYARRIMLVPVGVVAQAAGVASYPFLASLAAKGDAEGFTKTLSSSLRNTTAVLVPLSIWMIAVAGPTISLIFEQGRFDAADAAATALCLQILLAGVFCWGIQQLVGRAFYARQDTVSPAVIGTLATLAAVPAYWLLGSRFGAAGLAAASAGSVALYTLLLAGWWRRRHGGEVFAGLWRVLGGTLGLAVLAGLPAAGMVWTAGRISLAGPLLQAFLVICLSGVLFFLLYLWASARLMPDAAAPMLDLLGKIRRKFLRRTS